MNRRSLAAAAVALVFLCQSASATLSLSKRVRFDLNWYFHNTDAKYTEMDDSVGFFRDYNYDGIPDYFIALSDPVNGDWRMLTLNTIPTGGMKTYANRTAWRDIPAQQGVFYPRTLYTPYAPTMDSPDLVLVGTNATSQTENIFTRFTFWRLNKHNKNWPTEASWSIDVNSALDATILWPDISFDSDDYPDYLIYHQKPSPPGAVAPQFSVACYNGRTGARLWVRPIGLDPQDPGTGLPAFGFGFPDLTVQVLPHNPAAGLGGDFDGNGKPEILLYYTFSWGDFYSTYTTAADITLLKSDGNFLSPYSATWTRAATYLRSQNPPTPMIASDYDRDSFVDMMLLTTNPPFGGTVPVFRAYSLRTRQFLFQSQSSDFNNDLPSHLVLDQFRYGSVRRADLNRDRWHDLDVYRTAGFPTFQPLKIGLFNGFAGGNQAVRGRRIWMLQFNSFDRAFSNVNDFNGDDILDYVLLKTPDEPNSPTAGRITFNIAHTAVSPSNLTLGKQFTFAPSHTWPWQPSDTFTADPLILSRFGDVDGDGQRDTLASLHSGFQASDSNNWGLTYGYLMIYDNTPGLLPPPITAELEFKVQGEDWIPAPILRPGVVQGPNALVDNNLDGFINDMIINTGMRAVWSMSLQYRVQGGAPPMIQGAIFADLDNNGVDEGDMLILVMNRSVTVNTSILQPSHFSLPVEDDSLGGQGFGVVVSRNNSRLIGLMLGQGAHLTVEDVFSFAKTLPGSPSGIDFATSLPAGAVRGLDGLSAIPGDGTDLRYNVIGRTLALGTLGGVLSAVNSTDADYRFHRLTVPYGALGGLGTFTLRSPVRNLGVPGAFQILQRGGGSFLKPVTITAEFMLSDVDRELGYLVSEMRVHQLVERPLGTFNFLPLPGVHRITLGDQSAPAGMGKLDDTGQTVSADTSSLNPDGSLGTPGLFAGLPIETVDEREIDIKPDGTLSSKASVGLLTPGTDGAYLLHKLEFPGYSITTASDPARIVVKIRTATALERYSLTGGQSFPAQSGAVFVVTVTDALNIPIQFTDPVNVTVQFKERSDPTLTDVVRFDNSLGVAKNMRMVRDYSVDGIHFAFLTGVDQSVNVAEGTVTATGVLNLTDATGMGTYGAVAGQGATPVTHWELYP